MVRADHPSNSKRGVCFYHKELLLLRIININYLKECLRFQLKIGDKPSSFISLCRSPSQTEDEFETFTDNLELFLVLPVQSNTYLVVVIDSFNAKSKNWYEQDKTSFEEHPIESLFYSLDYIKSLMKTNSCIRYLLFMYLTSVYTQT